MPDPVVIGRYTVERLLGQGGMGRVWLARDGVLGRRVAIKVLRSDLAIPHAVHVELTVRMRHEAMAAAAVNHPNIVVLYDMGEDSEVGLYLVFEYVPGPWGPPAAGPQSLRDRLRSGALAAAEVAKLARELGSAVTFAHEAGVIHRDIKPENILFSRTGAKIADFGIARIPDSTLTASNTILGTPAYTAPEALRDGTFGPASDQFSLAATLYEAITGQQAFGGDDPIASAERIALGFRRVDARIPWAGHALTAALEAGMGARPEERFASCLVLGEAVGAALDRGEAEARDAADTPLGRAPLSSRKREPISLFPVGVGVSSGGDSPSLYMGKRSHRFQNIVAALAILVLVGLVLLGRKHRTEPESDARDLAATSAAKTPSAPPARASVRPVRPPVSPKATIALPTSAVDASVVEDQEASSENEPPPLP